MSLLDKQFQSHEIKAILDSPEFEEGYQAFRNGESYDQTKSEAWCTGWEVAEYIDAEARSQS